MKMTSTAPTMTSLAQPATLLGIADAVGVGVVFVYSYKKIGTLQEELEKIKVQLNNLTLKAGQVPEINKHIAQFGMLYGKLEETVMDIKKTQKRMKYRQDIIIKALERAGVEFKGDLSLHESSYKSDSEDENEEEEPERSSRSKRNKKHVRFGGGDSNDMNELVMKASRSTTS